MNQNSDNTILRPMMKISDMVPYLKNKNIKFEDCSEVDAENYLRENNNYYNVTAYKNNFPKYQCGELINFFEFFTNEYNLDDNKYIFILREVNKLRNAVAHNSCVLSELDKKDNLHRADTLVINYLKDCGIGKENRTNKLRNSRIRQITYTLYLFNEIVSSTGVKQNVNHELSKLFYGRIILNRKYYNNNGLLKSIYEYFDKIIEKNYKENLDQ